MPVRYTPEQRYQRAIALGILVDEEDAWLLSSCTWYISTGGYVMTATNLGERYKTTFLHHFIVGEPIYEGSVIDHIDRNQLNNRRPNLRYTTQFVNVLNSDVVEEASNINIHGGGRFQVRIRRNNVSHYVGLYNTMQEAQYARDKWLEEYRQLQDSNE